MMKVGAAPSAKSEADRIIGRLQLAPHPEGGWYRETWRGPQIAGRASGTAILFLLKAGEASHWHRVDADEMWLWHAGAPLTLAVAGDDGIARETRLGGDVFDGDTPQLLVPAHHWQAARADRGWALLSCTVVPGFDFAGFELAPPGWSPG